jgi:hypothetical protein
MGRILKNKYSDSIISIDDFYSDISSAITNEQERKDIAKGRIIISNRPNREGLYILNSDGDRVVEVGKSASGGIPGDVYDYVDLKTEESLSSAKTYTDLTKEDLIDIINEQRQLIEELSAYTMNLNVTDHFMLNETEYFELSSSGSCEISNETADLNGLSHGTVITYKDEIYYCIYEASGEDESGTTPTITGSTMEIPYDISDNIIILDNYAIISGNTLVFSEGGGQGGDGDSEINGNTIEDNSSYISTEDEHMVILSNNYVYNEENNEMIIM